MKKLLLLLSVIGLCTFAKAQAPRAVQNICDTLVINFTDSAHGLTVYFVDQTTTDGGLSIYDRVWTFGDSLSAPNDTSAALDPIHTFTAPGTYQVCLAIHAILAGNPGSEIHCYDTLCRSISVFATGINDIGAAGINMYPNPTGGKVQLTGFNGAGEQVYITDYYGQRVPATITNTGTILMPDAYANGIYFITIQQNGALYSRRILLNR